MKIHIASLQYASIENPHPIPAVSIKKVDVPLARSFRFGQGQTLEVQTTPFSLQAKVIIADNLVSRVASPPALDIYQMTFQTRDPKKVKIVTIFP